MAKTTHVNQPASAPATLADTEEPTSQTSVPAEAPKAPQRWRVEIPMCLCAPAVVEAVSESEALAAYMAERGILGTSQLPVVKRVSAESLATE